MDDGRIGTVIHSVQYIYNDFIYTELTFENGNKQYTYQHKNEVLGFPKLIYKEVYDVAVDNGVKIGEAGAL